MILCCCICFRYLGLLWLRCSIILDYRTSVVQNKVIWSNLGGKITTNDLCSYSPFKIRFDDIHRSWWRRRRYNCVIHRLGLILCSCICFRYLGLLGLRCSIILNNRTSIVQNKVIWSNLGSEITTNDLCADSPLKIIRHYSYWLWRYWRSRILHSGCVRSCRCIRFRLLGWRRLGSCIILNYCTRIIKN